MTTKEEVIKTVAEYYGAAKEYEHFAYVSDAYERGADACGTHYAKAAYKTEPMITAYYAGYKHGAFGKFNPNNKVVSNKRQEDAYLKGYVAGEFYKMQVEAVM